MPRDTFHSIYNDEWAKCQLENARSIIMSKTWTSKVIRDNVLYLSSQGKTTKEIATLLEITYDNVKFHKKQLMLEFKANNMTHAVYLWHQKLLEDYS